MYVSRLRLLLVMLKPYVPALQGTLTIFEDHESLTPVLSYNLAVCSLKSEDSKLVLTRTEKLYKHKVANSGFWSQITASLMRLHSLYGILN
jgi:hypothetical protein